MKDWKQFKISDCGTHHVFGGSSAYISRFDQVLAFHEPGLAPVQSQGSAWHIHPNGQAAYAKRFTLTFGFYEGLAAVMREDGSFHIKPDGEDAYSFRYVWCGNFQQSRCPVRDQEGHYFHINHEGIPAYDKRWKYVGDYYHHYAVVQSDEGFSTHIDREGKAVHEQWFLDLDVFHKGYARARDEDGWMHINISGKPIYSRRFAMVEPFYNGQARVERMDGGLEIIDEKGTIVVELRPARHDPLHQVSADLVSFWRCETIFTAVELNVFDDLPLEETSSGLLRLLHALGELGLVQKKNAKWDVTCTGALLQSDHPKSLAPAAKYWAGDGREGWKSLKRAVVDPTWRAKDPFVKGGEVPDVVAALHAALQVYAENDYACLDEIINESNGGLIDAGGATGTLAKFLLSANPELKAVVFDRPEVMALCDLNNFEGRLEFVGGDLFSQWPCAGDAIVLARVLHDWPDEECLRLLGHARKALRPNGHLYIVEMLRHPESFDGGLLSLHMMVTTGGKERTMGEYRCLLGSTGFRLTEVRTTRGINSVIVAEPL